MSGLKSLGTCVIVCSILLSAGCDSPRKTVDLNVKYVPTSDAPESSIDRVAQEQVAEAATTVGQSLQELSAMQLAMYPGQKIKDPLKGKLIGMGQLASVNWTGPVEPLLAKIANSAHYRFTVIGQRPATPVLVSIAMKNQPLANILRNAIYQIVMKANVAVYPRSKTLELRYRGN
jgi:defect-in-organelle-trafficking protein DotD